MLTTLAVFALLACMVIVYRADIATKRKVAYARVVQTMHHDPKTMFPGKGDEFVFR